MSPPLASDAAAERLRQRYPEPRWPRPLVAVTVVVLAAVFLTWVVWAAADHADAKVSGQVTSYAVRSSQEVAFTLTVDRPDPSLAAVCTVVARSADFQSVGALDVEVPPRAERLVDITSTVKTLRLATNASLRSCSLR